MVAATDIAAHVIGPDDPGYDDARAVFNAMIDRRPLAIVRCRDALDVAAGIRYAREHDLVLSVRGGGHGVAGNAVCDGGIMLDLSGMKDVTVDPVQRIAHAGPGLLLGELDAATQRHGLATPLGVMSGTGIAGLTLGGGLGWLNARYGLACDNLIGAEVVTADGDILQVGPDEHPDLLWGLRGGGGNLAVVTIVHLPAAPGLLRSRGCADPPLGRCPRRPSLPPRVHGVRAGRVDQRRLARPRPRRRLPPSRSSCAGPATRPKGNGSCGRCARSARPSTTRSACCPTSTGSGRPTPRFPRGRLHYWKSGYLRHLTDAALDALLAIPPTTPTPATGIGLQGLRGAAARVPVDATAFPHRAEQYDLLILAQWSEPARTDEHVGWARAAFDALRPHLEDAVYVNNLGTEGPERVRSAYGPNHARLAALKRTYDPANVFRLNQNVPPA